MFHLIEITTTAGTPSKAIYSYNTKKEAVANFHSKLGAQMKSASCNAELVMVIDDDGAVHACEKYNKPAEEPAEEE